jgi:hypothetical protein
MRSDFTGLLLGNYNKGRYSLRPKNFRPSQYAPPTRASAGKPTPTIGPGTPAVGPASAVSTNAAKPTKAKQAIRIEFMIGFLPHAQYKNA